ncbi:MAG: hypothetical protein MUC60_18095 [Oscillatoria sp. Prado101]|nr:hypothetical protein [Oscillatoria sp. Prado101]
MSLTLPASRDGWKKAEKKKRKLGLKISSGGCFIVGENCRRQMPVRERRDLALIF